MRVDLPLDKKAVENQDCAAGPPGRRGPWAGGRWPAFSKTHAYGHFVFCSFENQNELWEINRGISVGYRL